MNIQAAFKLALGTAQFGLDYGVANKAGKIPLSEAESILALARQSGVTTLDTAISYGDSEQVLGDLGVSHFQVITKLPALPDSVDDVPSWVDAQLGQSLSRLGVPAVHGLLLHRPAQLLGSHGPALYRALRNQQAQGKIAKIGISVYGPTELEQFHRSMRFDIVQAPVSVLDERMLKSGWAARLEESGCELHARSVFLQGLMLLAPEVRPTYFDHWSSVWKTWQGWLRETGLTALQACLRYAINLEGVSKVVVGVDNSAHLREILAALQGDLPSLPPALNTDDLALLNPALWPQT